MIKNCPVLHTVATYGGCMFVHHIGHIFSDILSTWPQRQTIWCHPGAAGHIKSSCLPLYLFLPFSTSTFLAFSSCRQDLWGCLNHSLFANVKIVFQPLKFYPRRSVLQLARVSYVRERGRGQTLAPHPGENLGLYRILWSPDFYVFYEHQL